jgi:hypothetical protein
MAFFFLNLMTLLPIPVESHSDRMAFETKKTNPSEEY